MNGDPSVTDDDLDSRIRRVVRDEMERRDAAMAESSAAAARLLAATSSPGLSALYADWANRKPPTLNERLARRWPGPHATLYRLRSLAELDAIAADKGSYLLRDRLKKPLDDGEVYLLVINPYARDKVVDEKLLAQVLDLGIGGFNGGAAHRDALEKIDDQKGEGVNPPLQLVDGVDELVVSHAINPSHFQFRPVSRRPPEPGPEAVSGSA